MEKHHSKAQMETTFRGHLPPPFYSGKDEIRRIGYPAEPGLPHISDEDSLTTALVVTTETLTARISLMPSFPIKDIVIHIAISVTGDNLSTRIARGTKKDPVAKDIPRSTNALKAVRVTEAKGPATTVVLMKGYSRI